MINPVVQDRKYLMVYSGIWILISGIHFAVFYFILNQSIIISVADSIFYNLSFALVGLVIWYLVRYNDFEVKKLPVLLFNHVVFCAIIVSSWIFINDFLMNSFFRESAYRSLADAGITSRGIAGLFYYITIGLAFYLIRYYQENRDQQIRAAQLSGQLKEAALITLRNQINPHFLFNSLNSISYLTLSDPEKAREMITRLSDFLRILLRENDRFTIPLEREMELARLYLEIEKFRFGDKLMYEEIIDDRCAYAQVPTLIILPLVENAVKHGVHDSTKPVRIKIRIEVKDEFMILEVSNTMEPGIHKKGEGLGLKNIRERLTLLYDKQNMEISKTKDIFTVKLTLPFRIDGKENSYIDH